MTDRADRREKISAVVITKNEEAEIEDCLASLTWVDEVILVDSESTDRTVAIAERLGVSLFVRPFTGFTEQKQHATDLALGPWILNLDADERVTPELRSEIERVLAGDGTGGRDGDHDGYTLPRRTWYAGGFIRHCWYPDRKLRLFRKGKGVWRGGSVHEGVEIAGEPGELSSPLLHYSFRTLSDHLQTIDRLTDLGARDLADHNRGRSFWNLVIRPPATFIKMYFLRYGFLDGWRGLVIAFLSAAHTAIKYAKARQIIDEKRGLSEGGS